MDPVFEMMRAMAGTVLSYQDKDYSIGLNWQRNDEMGDLVVAHNALGQTLREQRLIWYSASYFSIACYKHTSRHAVDWSARTYRIRQYHRATVVESWSQDRRLYLD